MMRALLVKDLRRARRNPVPWLVSLAVPLLITGLIGWIFGPRGGGGGLGEIRVAFVDEDQTALTGFLRGAMEQMTTAEPRGDVPFRLRARFVDRGEALRLLTEGELSAAVIVPAGFTDGYLDLEATTSIEVVKNPAQAIHPRVVEEALGLITTALNALRLVSGDSLGEVRSLVERDAPLFEKLVEAGDLLRNLRERLEPAADYLAPPRVGFTEVQRPDDAAPQTAGFGSGIFAHLLAGMAAMFLLYLADHAMRDLYREERFRTLERFKTLREGLLMLVMGKAVFAASMVLLGAAVLFGGGAVLFQFAWQRPWEVLGLVGAYAVCGAGITGLLAALAGRERRADVLNNLAIMGLALAGGCMFPPEMLPAFLRESIAPFLPTAWFAATVRGLQNGGGTAEWLVPAGKLVLTGAIGLGAATAIFRRRLEQGVRA
ncbi:MAG: ABC transporter permease [Verrucomicrobiae bacterium]|nr:ABC transporter permease [Verrucomicrobiae bacterium]